MIKVSGELREAGEFSPQCAAVALEVIFTVAFIDDAAIHCNGRANFTIRPWGLGMGGMG